MGWGDRDFAAALAALLPDVDREHIDRVAAAYGARIRRREPRLSVNQAAAVAVRVYQELEASA